MVTKELRKWMPLYWNDYFGGTQLFHNATEHGAYLLLIAYCWQHDGKLPPADNDRRRIAKCTRRQWQLIRATVLSKFDDEGRNERCDIELAHAIEKSKQLSANAKHRHYKSKAEAYTPTPTQRDKKERMTLDGGNGANGHRKTKPRHRQTTRDHRRIWLDAGTEDFAHYSRDYCEKHHAPVPLLWNDSGAWFNLRGEQGDECEQKPR